jgi:hypothetical protein
MVLGSNIRAIVRVEVIVISDRPQFREVGAQAGIDMLNRYYPAFLSTASRA